MRKMPMSLGISINRTGRPSPPSTLTTETDDLKLFVRDQPVAGQHVGLIGTLGFTAKLRLTVSFVDGAVGKRSFDDRPMGLGRELSQLGKYFWVAGRHVASFADIRRQIVQCPLAAARLNRFPIVHADRGLATDFPIQVLVL